MADKNTDQAEERYQKTIEEALKSWNQTIRRRKIGDLILLFLISICAAAILILRIWFSE